MAIYYGVGGAIVSDEEYTEKLQLGTFARVTEALRKQRSESFDIGGRTIMAADAFAGPAGNDFTPIKYGEPLAAEIRRSVTYSGMRGKRERL